ncbi:MAG: DUF2183 domain-containing protein [Pirellulaceae bacterium]|nr:DUF2183 domain-containing protein [Pirellulaceae bacterium]
MVHTISQFSQIEPHERVVIYPSYGYLDRNECSWKITIRGAVYEPCEEDVRDRILVRMLSRAMTTNIHELQSEVFQQRVSSFLAQHERGKQIVIRVGDKRYRLRGRTRRNGHFRGILRLSVDQVHQLRQRGHVRNGWIQFEVLTRHSHGASCHGQSLLIGSRGLSVISDIDDTIKRSNVPHRRELLANTFLRHYESIPGMADLYRRWEESGAVFHYVSSSPWQLFQSLDDFCHDDSFPAGSFHLRTLRLKDPRVLSLFLPTRWSKRRTIHSILRAFPTRRFILVGDSGERDPELYGSAARKYPDRVARIYIRDMATRSLVGNRMLKAYRGTPRDMWRVFDNAEQLANDQYTPT